MKFTAPLCISYAIWAGFTITSSFANKHRRHSSSSSSSGCSSNSNSSSSDDSSSSNEVSEYIWPSSQCTDGSSVSILHRAHEDVASLKGEAVIVEMSDLAHDRDLTGLIINNNEIVLKLESEDLKIINLLKTTGTLTRQVKLRMRIKKIARRFKKLTGKFLKYAVTSIKVKKDVIDAFAELKIVLISFNPIIARFLRSKHISMFDGIISINLNYTRKFFIKKMLKKLFIQPISLQDCITPFDSHEDADYVENEPFELSYLNNDGSSSSSSGSSSGSSSSDEQEVIHQEHVETDSDSEAVSQLVDDVHQDDSVFNTYPETLTDHDKTIVHECLF